jgi:NitT/TauT family transport system permease protein
VLLMLMARNGTCCSILSPSQRHPARFKYTAQLMRLSRWQKWRTLILPAIFPYLITAPLPPGRRPGMQHCRRIPKLQRPNLISDSIGALISTATASGDYALLLAATLALIITVIFVNRLLWRRLYDLAEEKYRLEV